MKPTRSKHAFNSSLVATEPLTQQIRTRAYQLYEQRGKEPGHHVEDWLQAETEIARRLTASSHIDSIAA